MCRPARLRCYAAIIAHHRFHTLRRDAPRESRSQRQTPFGCEPVQAPHTRPTLEDAHWRRARPKHSMCGHACGLVHAAIGASTLIYQPVYDFQPSRKTQAISADRRVWRWALADDDGPCYDEYPRAGQRQKVSSRIIFLAGVLTQVSRRLVSPLLLQGLLSRLPTFR